MRKTADARVARLGEGRGAATPGDRAPGASPACRTLPAAALLRRSAARLAARPRPRHPGAPPVSSSALPPASRARRLPRPSPGQLPGCSAARGEFAEALACSDPRLVPGEGNPAMSSKEGQPCRRLSRSCCCRQTAPPRAKGPRNSSLALRGSHPFWRGCISPESWLSGATYGLKTQPEIAI